MDLILTEPLLVAEVYIYNMEAWSNMVSFVFSAFYFHFNSTNLVLVDKMCLHFIKKFNYFIFTLSLNISMCGLIHR